MPLLTPTISARMLLTRKTGAVIATYDSDKTDLYTFTYQFTGKIRDKI